MSVAHVGPTPWHCASSHSRAVGPALRLDGVLMVTREAGKTPEGGFFAVWLIVKEKIHL